MASRSTTLLSFKDQHWNHWEQIRSHEEELHARKTVELLKGQPIEDIAAHCSGVLQRYITANCQSRRKIKVNA